MKSVQIPYDLFIDLAMYHLRGEDEYEDEMYGSYEKMREYLQDPILLINNMKKKRVGNII